MELCTAELGGGAVSPVFIQYLASYSFINHTLTNSLHCVECFGMHVCMHGHAPLRCWILKKIILIIQTVFRHDMY